MNLKKIVIEDIEKLGSNIYLDFNNEELYLYLSSIKNILEPQKLYNYLSISEIEKANNFKFEEDTFRFILGHGLTRRILGKYLGIFPSKLIFNYGDSGKPQVENTEQNIFFNISHSNEFVAIIFSKIRLIGVDIEHIDKNKENEKIVRGCFKTPYIHIILHQNIPDKIWRKMTLNFLSRFITKNAILITD